MDTDTTTTTDVPPVTRPWRRRLRIAWSVFFGVLTVTLCLLWVSSYYSSATVWEWLPINRYVQVRSNYGGLEVIVTMEHHPSQIHFDSVTLDFRRWELVMYGGYPPRFSVLTPHWLLVILSAVLTALPWLPFRFSLRTMLIATTLIAVVLGLSVWLAS